MAGQAGFGQIQFKPHTSHGNSYPSSAIVAAQYLGRPKKMLVCDGGGQQLQMVPFNKLHTPWVGALVHLVSASVF